MTSEPVTAVIVIERTSGLSISLSEMCVVSQAGININKRAKVMLSFIWNTDLIMLIQNHT